MGRNKWDASCGRCRAQRKGLAIIEDVGGYSVSVSKLLSRMLSDMIVPFILSFDGSKRTQILRNRNDTTHKHESSENVFDICFVGAA